MSYTIAIYTKNYTILQINTILQLLTELGYPSALNTEPDLKLTNLSYFGLNFITFAQVS